MSRTIYIDRESGSIVRDRGFTISTPLPVLTVGDVVPLRVVLLDSQGNLDPDSGNGSITPKIAIGDCSGPSGGTYQLSGDGDLTLNHNALPTPAQIATITDATASDISVVGVAGEVYRITFTVDPSDTLSISANALTPTSTATATQIKAWDGTSEIWVVRLKKVPLAFSDSFTPFDETGSGGDKGWEGVLSVADIEMFQDVLSSPSRQLTSTFELELSGSIGPETVTQQPVTVRCEVIVSGQSTQPFSNGILSAADFTSGKTIYVDKDSPSATDTRGSISKYSYIYPFATITAATAAAASGDTIKVLAGDYSAEGTINTKAGVFYDIGPSVSVVRVNSLSGNRTIKGNAAPINIESTATLTLIDAVISSALSVQVADSASLNLINCRITNDFENGTILTILNGWSGSLLIKDCTLTALNAGATDGATIGIDVQGTTTGAIRLEGNTIIRTAQTGAGDSHSIASSSAKDITNVGTLFNTHAPDANVTVLIGNVVTDTAI